MFEPECKMIYSEMSDEELKVELDVLTDYTKTPVYTIDTEIEYHIQFLKDKLKLIITKNQIT